MVTLLTWRRRTQLTQKPMKVKQAFIEGSDRRAISVLFRHGIGPFVVRMDPRFRDLSELLTEVLAGVRATPLHVSLLRLSVYVSTDPQ